MGKGASYRMCNTAEGPLTPTGDRGYPSGWRQVRGGNSSSEVWTGVDIVYDVNTVLCFCSLFDKDRLNTYLKLKNCYRI